MKKLVLSGIQKSAEIAVPSLNPRRLSIAPVVVTDGIRIFGKPLSGIYLWTRREPAARHHGMIIFILSVVMSVLWALI